MSAARPRGARRRIVYFLAVGALLLGSCGSGGGEEEPRRAVLIDLASTVIVPSYRDFADAADRLALRAAELEVEPGVDTLDALRESWRETRSFWKRSQAFEFGPAESLRTGSKVDWSPIRESRVESAIDTDGPLDGAYVEDLGSNQKGFLALQYLLFDPVEGEPEVEELLVGDGGERRREFVRGICDNIADQARRLYDAWRPEGENFAFELGEAGRASETYPTIKSALDDLLNQMIFLAEEVADAQLLAAIGRDGVPDPSTILVRDSGNGKRDAIDNLTSILNVYLARYPGQAPNSLRRLVGRLNLDTDEAIRSSMVESIELLVEIPEPLHRSVEIHRDEVVVAQQAAKEVMRRLEIDLITILGGTLRFNPGDGD